MKLLIFDSEILSSEKSTIADVIIKCDGEQARVIKDRQGIAFNASFAVDRIHQFIDAVRIIEES